MSKLWPFLFASLLLDPLLPFVIEGATPAPVALSAATALSILLLPCLAQSSLQRSFSRLRTFHRKNLEQPSKLASALLLLAVSAGLLPKLFMAAAFNSMIFAAVVLAFVGLIATSFRKTVREQRRDQVLMQDNPWIQIETWESQLVVLNLAPLFAARAISLCGVFVALPADEYASRLPFFVVGALFLAMLKPHKRFFIGNCARCRALVPIVFVEFGSCLRCNEVLLMSYAQSLEEKHRRGITEASASREVTAKSKPR